MRALILAAGLATRLAPLSDTVPKAALPVLNRPLLHHVLDWLGRCGLREAAVNLHHLPEEVRRVARQYDRPGWALRYSDERARILLTAGALAPLKNYFEGKGTLVLVNGKIVTDLDLGAALAFHRKNRCLATLITVPNTTGEPFSHVKSAPDGMFEGVMHWADAVGQNLEPCVFTGIHLIEPDLLRHVAPGVPSDTVRDLYPALRARGLPVGVFRGDGLWMEFSTPERYLRNTIDLLRMVSGDGAHLDFPVAMGTGGRMPGSANGNWRWPQGVCCAGREPGIGNIFLKRSVLGPGTELEDGAAVSESIFHGENRVNRNAVVQNCILGRWVNVPSGKTWRNLMVTTGSGRGREGLVKTPLRLDVPAPGLPESPDRGGR